MDNVSVILRDAIYVGGGSILLTWMYGVYHFIASAWFALHHGRLADSYRRHRRRSYAALVTMTGLIAITLSLGYMWRECGRPSWLFFNPMHAARLHSCAGTIAVCMSAQSKA